MYRLAILIILGLIFHPAGKAQQAKTQAEMRAEAEASQAEANRQELVVLVREDGHAMQLGNSSFFHRVYGEDFVGINDHGQRLAKMDMVRLVQSGEPKYISVVVSDITVRFFQDTAVVQSLWSLRGTERGRTFSRQKRMIHVYVNGGRGWQVVASQMTPLPGEGQ